MLKITGTHVITNDYQLGFIHPSEREVEPRLGEVVNARVIGVNDRGELNLSLKPRAFEAIGDDAQMILAALQHSQAHCYHIRIKVQPMNQGLFWNQ